MNKLVLFLLPLFAFVFTSCEPEEADLRFSTVSSSDNVHVRYESPDPSCFPKIYTIATNSEAGELTLKCKDAKKIYIENDPESPSRYVSTKGSWVAEMISSNKVKIVFDKIENNPDEEGVANFHYDYIVFAANKKGGKVTEAITIYR